ncbi:hypothetical protein [Salinimicrobium sp. HB62]|uniref:hypothetical protein n=1 Tax=Salinimicrobium sp. HB62 TaxID=3077781 RepID=UPI002D7899A1|nr:hypothetical protein [Salinimicrobium sp. HB62]
MKNIFLKTSCLLILLLSTFSCSVDRDDETSILGTWTETAPVAGRTTLVFGADNRLTRIDGDGNSEVYIYRIEDRTLYLSLASGTEGTSEIFLEQINTNKLKTGNLYPSIPEAEPVFLIFERY